MRGCRGRHAWLPGGHVWLPGGMCGLGGCMVARGGVCGCRGGCAWLPGGCMPCDLCHHAFDVTCMLSLLQLRLNRNAAAYIVLVMWHARPPPGKNCWHMLLKILPCPNFVAGGKNTGRKNENIVALEKKKKTNMTVIVQLCTTSLFYQNLLLYLSVLLLFFLVPKEDALIRAWA